MSLRSKAAALVSALATMIAVFAFLGGGVAQAIATVPVQVKIYLENNNHNAGSVTTSCGASGPLLHTAVFNDAIGANVAETVKIYREDGGNANAANWPVVCGPRNVPIGGHPPLAPPSRPAPP